MSRRPSPLGLLSGLPPLLGVLLRVLLPRLPLLMRLLILLLLLLRPAWWAT